MLDLRLEIVSGDSANSDTSSRAKEEEKEEEGGRCGNACIGFRDAGALKYTENNELLCISDLICINNSTSSGVFPLRSFAQSATLLLPAHGRLYHFAQSPSSICI
jgi:hypothetical protein